MRFPNFPAKFLLAAATTLAVVLILALSASVDAGDKHKNKGGGGGGGNKHSQNCPPPLVKKGGGCVMPGGGNAGKANNKANKGQAGNRFDTKKQGGKHHDNKKFGGAPIAKKHGGKAQAGKQQDNKKHGGKAQDDKKQAGKHNDNKKQGGKPQDEKKFGGAPIDKKHGDKTADDNKKGGKHHDGGKTADDDKDAKGHGGGKGGKHGGNEHAGNQGHKDCKPPFVYSWRAKDCVKGEHRGPERVGCKGALEWRKGRGCVRPGHPGYDCGWPMIKIGRTCVCGPGFISRHGECWRPPVIVVPVGPIGPGPYPEGPYPEEPYPEGPYPDGPPAIGPGGPPQQAEPLPPEEGPEEIAEPELQPEPKPQPVADIEPVIARCLPDDLYDLLEDTYGRRPDLDRCPAACLPKPIFYTPAELDELADKYGVNWCENCLQVGGYMPLPSILRLERAANVTICVNPDMCRVPSGIGGGYAGEGGTTIQTIFKDLPAGTDNEGNIAVVIGNHQYQGELPDNPDGAADADAVMALLIDQLGYKEENIIDLRDAKLGDLKRVFGSDDDPGGELAKRIDKDDPGNVFIYIASHGLVKEDDGKAAYLLPVDAKVDLLDDTAYAMQDLYNNLGKVGARTIMLMLEANFANNLDALIDPPNLPELEVEAMPAEPVPGLAVFKASDRDQKAIQDPEYGIGLFTRYLIEGLAGRADEAPLGNGDKSIDTVELYVYTADAVRTAARKSFGLEQKPLLSKIDNLVVGKLSSN